MAKSIFFSVICSGTLVSLPLLAQETPPTAPPPTASASASSVKSLTPSENAAVESMLKKTLILSFQMMAELSPEEMTELSTNKASKPAIRLMKRLLEVPLDPNLPQFWKNNYEENKLASEELIQAVESNAPEAKKNELSKKVEKVATKTITAAKEHGVNLDEITKKHQLQLQAMMGEISMKIISDNPDAAKDPQAMMKSIFREVANKLENESKQ